MTYRKHITIPLLLAAAAGVATAVWQPAAAQDNPFGVGEAAAERPAADEPMAEPAGVEPPAAATAQPAAPPRTAPTGGPALADFARRDPTIAAVLEIPRDTAAGKMRALLALVNLGHAEAAGLVARELLQQPLDDSQRAALVGEFGSAAFLRLIWLDGPAPVEAAPRPLAGLRDFSQSCLDAAATQARDPARVAALAAQLNAATPEERYAARVDLEAAGDVGVIACFLALSQADTAEARGHLMTALAAMRPAIDEPLVAVLADAQGPLQRDAAKLAGRIRLGAAAPWLSAIAVSPDNPAAASAAVEALAALGLPAPSVAEAEELLRRKLRDARSEPVSTIDEGTVGVWWSWDPAAKQLVAKEFAPAQLRTLGAARLGRALAGVSGLADSADGRRVVAYELEEAALWGRPISAALRQLIAGMTPAALSEALGEALAGDYRPAAIALAGEIAARGDASVLASSNGRPTPLAAALTNAARDVRFAAVAAIMKLAPPMSFAGSSQVAQSLWYFASGAGQPAAVAAASDIVVASDWAGQLRAAGYDATAVRTGREAMLAAVDPEICSRLAIVVVDSDVGQPLVGEVAYQLHASDQTAGVPVLIACSGERLATAQRIAQVDPLVLATAQPQREGELAALVDQTRALSGRPIPPDDVRTAQAEQALRWIAQLLANGSPYDELQRGAKALDRTLLAPPLTAATIDVLAVVGTSESQRALADAASGSARPVEARRGAAKALAQSVAKFGLQLSRDEILRQYDRYNASATADADTQQVLGEILDIIERKPPAP
ncbi:MAG: hypothetical protein IT424_14255 [Pirellulales bacterium]|nr:hypothetical protein [Pirellulales bacterium]